MSVNRSVAAAQRRRVGQPETNQMRSGPNTSINSAQLFANQAKPGNGPSIPIGKLSAQQAAAASRQYESNSNIASVENFSKMTVPQAITLITLRLGKLETTVQNQSQTLSSSYGLSNEVDSETGMSQIDSNLIQTIVSRLESLEKRSSASSGASGPELALLKQQVDTFKPLFTQNKSATASIVKENKELRSQIDILRQELDETKELVIALQNITMDNSQKLLTLSVNEVFDEEQLLNGFEQHSDTGVDADAADADTVDTELHDSVNDISIVNLKELVKQELHLDA